METKEGTTFVSEEATFLPPYIKQANNGQLAYDFFEDCTIVTPIPSSAEQGDEIAYFLHVDNTGSFFQTPKVITQELLSQGDVVWQLFPFNLLARPGSAVRLYYNIWKGEDRFESPKQEYVIS